MNNVLNRPQKGTETSEIVKYITFKLHGYLFALPAQEILKVVTTPPPSQGGMVSMGLVQLEQYSIQTLNLSELISLGITANADQEAAKTAPAKTAPAKTAPENPPFLMVLRDVDQNLWGIAVESAPDLMDIPNYALKPVPPEKRLTRALRWVSYVVTYDLGGDRHTLLVLDLSVLLASKQTQLSPGGFPKGGFPEGSFPEIEPPIDFENSAIRQSEMYA
jgi:chemotaxis signal transduction protein